VQRGRAGAQRREQAPRLSVVDEADLADLRCPGPAGGEPLPGLLQLIVVAGQQQRPTRR